MWYTIATYTCLDEMFGDNQTASRILSNRFAFHTHTFVLMRLLSHFLFQRRYRYEGLHQRHSATAAFHSHASTAFLASFSSALLYLRSTADRLHTAHTRLSLEVFSFPCVGKDSLLSCTAGSQSIYRSIVRYFPLIPSPPFPIRGPSSHSRLSSSSSPFTMPALVTLQLVCFVVVWLLNQPPFYKDRTLTLSVYDPVEDSHLAVP